MQRVTRVSLPVRRHPSPPCVRGVVCPPPPAMPSGPPGDLAGSVPPPPSPTPSQELFRSSRPESTGRGVRLGTRGVLQSPRLPTRSTEGRRLGIERLVTADQGGHRAAHR